MVSPLAGIRVPVVRALTDLTGLSPAIHDSPNRCRSQSAMFTGNERSTAMIILDIVSILLDVLSNHLSVISVESDVTFSSSAVLERGASIGLMSQL